MLRLQCNAYKASYILVQREAGDTLRYTEACLQYKTPLEIESTVQGRVVGHLTVKSSSAAESTSTPPLWRLHSHNLLNIELPVHEINFPSVGSSKITQFLTFLVRICNFF